MIELLKVRTESMDFDKDDASHVTSGQLWKFVKNSENISKD